MFYTNPVCTQSTIPVLTDFASNILFAPKNNPCLTWNSALLHSPQQSTLTFCRVLGSLSFSLSPWFLFLWRFFVSNSHSHHFESLLHSFLNSFCIHFIQLKLLPYTLHLPSEQPLPSLFFWNQEQPQHLNPFRCASRISSPPLP